jgi:hypothetical protein
MLIPKNIQMIRDHMSIPAFWTCNEDRTMMIALLGDAVRGAGGTGFAGEC